MDIKRFFTALPDEYYAWGTLACQPRDPLRYVTVLDRVQAMTTPATMHLLNTAVRCLDAGEAYLEVGTWRGATLIGALLGRDAPGYAIDDDTMNEHDGDDRQSRAVWEENVEEFGVSATYINGTVPGIFSELRLPPIGVYFFDGDKSSTEAAYAGLAGAVPLLAQQALIICDDANTPQIREAAFWFCHRHRDRATKILDFPTPGNTWPSFWNGLIVVAWGVTVEEGA